MFFTKKKMPDKGKGGSEPLLTEHELEDAASASFTGVEDRRKGDATTWGVTRDVKRYAASPNSRRNELNKKVYSSNAAISNSGILLRGGEKRNRSSSADSSLGSNTDYSVYGLCYLCCAGAFSRCHIRMRRSGFLVLSLILQSIFAIVFVTVADHEHGGNLDSRPVVLAALVGIQVLQVVVSSVANYLLLARITDPRTTVSFDEAFNQYLSNAIVWGGIYVLARITLGRGAFAHNGVLSSADIDEGPLGTVVHYLYFSIETQTLVGFGDFAPLHPVVQVLSAIQMTLGFFYSVVIIAITAGNHDEDFALHEETYGKRVRAHGLLRQIIVDTPWVRTSRRFVRRNLLYITISVQLAFYTVLFAIDSNVFHRENDSFENDMLAFGFIVQAIQLLVTVALSLKAVHHKAVLTPRFLIHSFLTVSLTFGGIYTITYLAGRESFYIPCVPKNINSTSTVECKSGHSANWHRKHNHNHTGAGGGGGGGGGGGQWEEDAMEYQNNFIIVCLRFIYFSITVSTGVGYGNIFPSAWYSLLLVSAHMLLQQVFLVVVVGIGIQKLHFLVEEKALRKEMFRQRMREVREAGLGTEAFMAYLRSGGQLLHGKRVARPPQISTPSLPSAASSSSSEAARAGAAAAAVLSRHEVVEENPSHHGLQEDQQRRVGEGQQEQGVGDGNRTNTTSFDAAYSDWLIFLESGKLPAKSKK